MENEFYKVSTFAEKRCCTCTLRPVAAPAPVGSVATWVSWTRATTRDKAPLPSIFSVMSRVCIHIRHTYRHTHEADMQGIHIRRTCKTDI